MRVLVAPQHVGTGMAEAFQSVARRRPRVATFTELDLGPRSFVGQLQAALGKAYTVLSKDLGQHSEEIPVAVRGKVLEFTLEPLSRNVAGPGTGNDRWLARVVYRPFIRRHVLLHTHTNAVIQSHHTGEMLDNAREHVTVKAMQTFEERLSADLDDPRFGGRVSVTGDFNILPVGPGTPYPHATPWEHGPQEMFQRLGMEWRNSRVIYYACGPGYRLKSCTVIPPHSAENPSDHGWLWVIVRSLLRRRKG